ncbi:pyridoxamine 5'-phosphate oxidase family protein [Enterococcus sp. AZ192]|uniref:pyridoxamine 5'-phosphate oxidase family protein n=1 Tax=unclassified Enterococcus TaxID=2608891 RepID=UPI003D2D6C07
MDKQIIEHAKELLATCDSFLLSTNDRNGFPNAIVVSKPIIRASFYNLKFYVNGNGQTVENILHNKKGNVCCFDEARHESVLLKGIFSVEDIEEFKLLKDRLNHYQKELNHENPVVLSFEVYTVKVHSQTKTFWKDVDDFDDH